MSAPRCSAGESMEVEEAAPTTDPIEWLARFRARLGHERVPVAGTMELTRRCNLDCSHCYLGSRKERGATRGGEMSTELALDLVEQIAEAGCLSLLLTGGDPMIRPDFAEIYGRARRLGMLVTVFCNGTLISDRVVEEFRQLPPQMVEISIYGSRAATHDRVTRMPGSLTTLLAAVERLKSADIRVGLKTVLMTLNQSELDAMRRMARELEVPFRMDAAIMPCLHPSDRRPIDYRMDAIRAVELELDDPETRETWQRYAARVPASPADDRLYQCGAGRTNFAISPEGMLSPCLVMPHVAHDLRDRRFADIWAEEMVSSIGQAATNGYPCHDCSVRAACTACPATHRLETGREDLPGSHACAAANRRWQLLGLDAVEGTMEADKP